MPSVLPASTKGHTWIVQGRMGASNRYWPSSPRGATSRLRITMSASPYSTVSASFCARQGDNFSCAQCQRAASCHFKHTAASLTSHTCLTAHPARVQGGRQLLLEAPAKADGILGAMAGARGGTLHRPARRFRERPGQRPHDLHRRDGPCNFCGRTAHGTLSDPVVGRCLHPCWVPGCTNKPGSAVNNAAASYTLHCTHFALCQVILPKSWTQDAPLAGPTPAEPEAGVVSTPHHALEWR